MAGIKQVFPLGFFAMNHFLPT